MRIDRNALRVPASLPSPRHALGATPTLARAVALAMLPALVLSSGCAPELSPDGQPGGAPEIGLFDSAGAPLASPAPYGDQIVVRVEGLIPAERVSLSARLGGCYSSHAVFEADDQGRIDLARDAPLEGSYSGVDPDGIIWSMVAEPGCQWSEDFYTVELALARGGDVIAQVTATRKAVDADLVRLPVSDDGLVGTFYAPAGAAGRVPAVLVLGGSEGGLDYADFWAAYLASRGYATLGLAYFRATGLPQGLTEIPLEYFDKAMAWLAARPEADPDRLALAGVSRGGELALMLAARMPQVRAVIAMVPSGVRWGSASSYDKAAWTADGVPLPYIDEYGNAQPGIETLAGGETGYRYAPMFEAALAAAGDDGIAAATIPVEQSRARFLLIGGADDGMWPSCELAQIAMDRLRDSGHAAAHGDELVCYPDTGHDITEPGWPTTDSYGFEEAGGFVVLGGKPAGIAAAQRDADRRIRALLASL